MNLKSLPGSILVALGLASCGDDVTTSTASGDEGGDDGAEATTGPCLGVADDGITSCLSSPPTTGESSDVGPCLGAVTDEGTTGPCLSPEDPSTSTGSESDSGTSGSGSDSESSSGSSSSSTSARAPSRAEALERVESVLPPDVVQRLQARTKGA